jgi:hypothetical protein
MTKKIHTDLKRIVEQHKYDKEYDLESERGKVILGAARLDDLLRLLISRTIVNGNDTESDDIFDGSNALLQSFGAKISIAYRFGLVSEVEYKNLKIIKDIRNQFAHNLHDISFNHEWVSKQCAGFLFPAPFVPNSTDTNFFRFQSALYKLDLELQHRISKFVRLTAQKDIKWVESGSSLIIND